MVDPSDAPPQQELMTEPTRTPTSDNPPIPFGGHDNNAPPTDMAQTAPHQSTFSLGKTALQVTFQASGNER
jgi:hypothetical protein